MAVLSEKIEKILRRHGQEHLLHFAEALSGAELAGFERQLSEIEWEELSSLIDSHVKSRPDRSIPADISPAPYYPLPTSDPALKEKYSSAMDVGAKLIRDGRVALLTVAGGQGTRLGFDGPKGTYPISPAGGKSFFQYFSEKIRGANRKYGIALDWLIMTSPVNRGATLGFFEANNYFGLDRRNVHFFVQGTMPAISYDGRVLMESKSSLALSPNGHGGTIRALHDSGLLRMLENKGVEVISYFQIDNLIVPILDTLFIGLHHMDGSQVSSRMLAKTGPFEKLGNFCMSEGRLHIVEYSDMPEDLALQRDRDGRLLFISGSPAIHVFSLDFLDRLGDPASPVRLPWHRADKKVAFVDGSGRLVKPEKPNAVKLETFIFDCLPLAEKTIILEGMRDEQFSPTKNPDGVDSVESARRMLSERDARWLEAAGIEVPRSPDGSLDCVVELSPMKYYDAEDVSMLKGQITPPRSGEKRLYS